MSIANQMADTASAIAGFHFGGPALLSREERQKRLENARHDITGAVCSFLRQVRPGDSINAGPACHRDQESPFHWTVSPITDAQAFVQGNPTFATTIALSVDHHPTIGLIDFPVINRRYAGCDARPTRVNGDRIQTRPASSLGQSILSCHRFDLADRELRKGLKKISRKVGQTESGAGTFAFGQLASGLVDFSASAILSHAEALALVPVIEGAGGSISSWGGVPIQRDFDGTVLASASKSLHIEALGHLREFSLAAGKTPDGPVSPSLTMIANGTIRPMC